MTMIDDKAVGKYLDLTVNRIFKILPLYEEGNETLDEYIQSLILELRGFVSEYGNVGVTDYMSVISTLEGLRYMSVDIGNQPEIKREVFKCIETIKKIRNMLEGA